MNPVSNQTTSNWKDLVPQVRDYCASADALLQCVDTLHSIGVDDSSLLDPVRNALDISKDIRNQLFTKLVIALTDLDARGAAELIQQMTRYEGHATLAYRLQQYSDPPLVKYDFGWWLTLETPSSFFDDGPF